MDLTIITIAICALCVVIALWGWINFQLKSSAIFTDLKNANGTLNQTSMSQKLSAATSEYEKSFKGNLYTTEYAEDYINSESVAAAYGINLKVLNTLPNILTSIGILGTFIGLTIALSQFDSDSSEQIRRSINSLLGGMSSAFWTSVAGMFCSAVFLFYSKKRLNRMDQAIATYASDLNRGYHAANDQVLMEALSYPDSNGVTTHRPGEALSALVDGISGMKQSVDNLGMTITTGIKDAMDDAFKTTLVPIIDNLAKKLENPAQAVTDSLVKELSQVCEDFKNGLTESVNNQMEDLLEKFIDASNAINTIPETIERVNKNITDASEQTIEANKDVARTIEEQALRLNDLCVSLADTLEKIEGSSDSIADVHDRLADMPQSLKDASDAIVQSTGRIASTNTQISTAIDNIKAANDATTDSVNNYTAEIKAIETGLQAIFASINAGLAQYAAAAKSGLQTMLDPFTTSITDATEKVANSIAPLSDAIDELSTFGDTVKKVLADLDVTLKPIERSIDNLAKKTDHLNNNITK